MKKGASIRYALLGMVSTCPDGIHGFALKRQCDKVLGSFWQLNFGEVYRVLDRLAADKLIETIDLDDEDESRKKVYRITERGRQSLDDFILTPPADAPRPLRQELAVKILFAGPEQLPDVLKLIDAQREVYLQQLMALGSQRRRLKQSRVDAFVVQLLIGGAELSVRAELTWLDEVTQRLQERCRPAP